MAALPYMQLYVADYLADTAHLSTLEHGAYLLLIFNYWQRGESFKSKDQRSLNKRLASVARMSNEEWEFVKESLSEFFEISETEWSHSRLDRDLDAVNAKSEKAKVAGRASFAAKSRKSDERSTDVEQTFNERSTDVEQTFNERSTDVEQTFNHKDTDTEKEREREKEKQEKEREKEKQEKEIASPQAAKRVREKPQEHTAARPQTVSEDVWNDFLKLRTRKKAPLTQTALDLLEREAASAGVTVQTAITTCCARGWAGFRAEWMLPNNVIAQQRPQQISKSEATAASNNALLESYQVVENFIEGECHAA